MIITRTPFRLTLGGGGTDLPSFYREHGGFILSVAVDKYMYLNVNAPILDDKIRVKYAKTELVDHVDQVEHTLAREALRHFDISKGIEIVSIADIPAGTGLGSSSAYLVGLLNAMHALTQSPVGPQQLAEEACHIELEILQKPIGKQDQYMAAFGGLTMLEIARDGNVSVTRLGLDVEVLEALEHNLLMFYTHDERDATAILRKQDSATKRKDSIVVSSLREIKDIGIESCAAIVDGNLRRFGELMDIHWQTKKRLAALAPATTRGTPLRVSPRFAGASDRRRRNAVAARGRVAGPSLRSPTRSPCWARSAPRSRRPGSATCSAQPVPR